MSFLNNFREMGGFWNSAWIFFMAILENLARTPHWTHQIGPPPNQTESKETHATFSKWRNAGLEFEAVNKIFKRILLKSGILPLQGHWASLGLAPVVPEAAWWPVLTGVLCTAQETMTGQWSNLRALHSWTPTRPHSTNNTHYSKTV